MYDMYVPIIKDAKLELSYEEACELVMEGLRPLGKEYGRILKKAIEERWIDVFESEGKRSGAYSFGVYGVHPFVLLNYEKTAHDVFTIAHELGHSLHSYFSSRSQPYSKADYIIFIRSGEHRKRGAAAKTHREQDRRRELKNTCFHITSTSSPRLFR